VASSYESYGLKKFMGKEYMGMSRTTFVVGTDGNLETFLHASAPTLRPLPDEAPP
jgi:peroxiredoxin Q/BCP